MFQTLESPFAWFRDNLQGFSESFQGFCLLPDATIKYWRIPDRLASIRHLKHGKDLFWWAAFNDVWLLSSLSHGLLEILHEKEFAKLSMENTISWIQHTARSKSSNLHTDSGKRFCVYQGRRPNLIDPQKLDRFFRQLLLNIRSTEYAFEIHPCSLLISTEVDYFLTLEAFGILVFQNKHKVILKSNSEYHFQLRTHLNCQPFIEGLRNKCEPLVPRLHLLIITYEHHFAVPITVSASVSLSLCLSLYYRIKNKWWTQQARTMYLFSYASNKSWRQHCL